MKRQRIYQLYYDTHELTPFIDSGEAIVDFEGKIDWEETSSSGHVSEELMRKFPEFLDWKLILENQKVSDEMIDKNAFRVNFDTISKYKFLSLDFIKAHANSVDWVLISKYNVFLTDEFIRRFADRIDWDNKNIMTKVSIETINENIDNILNNGFASMLMVQHANVPLSFIEKYWDRLDIDHVCQNYDLPIEFINSHIDSVSISTLYNAKRVDNDWIIDNAERIDLYDLLEFSELDEEFIEKLLPKIIALPEGLEYLSEYQELSEEFISNYRVLPWKTLIENQNLSITFLLDMFEYWIDIPNILNTIIECQDVNKTFLHTFADDIDWDIVCKNYIFDDERFILHHKKYISTNGYRDLIDNANAASIEYSERFYSKMLKHLQREYF